MAEKFSVLMVRDGIISDEDLDNAIERQVLCGGSLDTNFLELSISDEPTITYYLSSATKKPSVSFDTLKQFPFIALEKLSPKLAKYHRFIPFDFSNNTLSIMVQDNADQRIIEAIASDLKLKIIPHITTEMRIFEALNEFYHSELPDRYRQLIDKYQKKIFISTQNQEDENQEPISIDALAFMKEQQVQAPSSNDEPADQIILTIEANQTLQNIDPKDPLEDDSTETRFIPIIKPDVTPGVSIENMIDDAISELEQKEPTQKISIPDIPASEESPQNISSAVIQPDEINEVEAASKTQSPSVLQEFSLDNDDTNENTVQPNVSEAQNILENSKQIRQKESSLNSIEGVSELTPIIDKPSEEKNEFLKPKQMYHNQDTSSTHQESVNHNIVSPQQNNVLQSDPEAIKKFTLDHIKQLNAANHIDQLSEQALDFFKTFLSFVVFFKAKDSQTLAGVSFQSDFTIASSIDEIICSINQPNQPHFISQSIQKRIPFYGNLSDEDKTLDLYFSFGKFPPDAAVFFPLIFKDQLIGGIYGDDSENDSGFFLASSEIQKRYIVAANVFCMSLIKKWMELAAKNHTSVEVEKKKPFPLSIPTFEIKNLAPISHSLDLHKTDTDTFKTKEPIEYITDQPNKESDSDTETLSDHHDHIFTMPLQEPEKTEIATAQNQDQLSEPDLTAPDQIRFTVNPNPDLIKNRAEDSETFSSNISEADNLALQPLSLSQVEDVVPFQNNAQHNDTLSFLNSDDSLLQEISEPLSLETVDQVSNTHDTMTEGMPDPMDFQKVHSIQENIADEEPSKEKKAASAALAILDSLFSKKPRSAIKESRENIQTVSAILPNKIEKEDSLSTDVLLQPSMALTENKEQQETQYDNETEGKSELTKNFFDSDSLDLDVHPFQNSQNSIPDEDPRLDYLIDQQSNNIPELIPSDDLIAENTDNSFIDTAADIDVLEDLITELVSGDTVDEEALFKKIIMRKERAIENIMELFPGNVSFDPFTVKKAPPIAEAGSLIRMVIAFGENVIDYIEPLIHDPDRNIRYFALYACSEFETQKSSHLLFQGLADPEIKIADMCALCLRKMKGHKEFEHILHILRQSLSSTDQTRLKVASRQLGMLRDCEAVPYLIDILRSKYTAAYKEAEEALEKICKQNFEDKARKWAGWHEKFVSKPWIEWLIEGLKHKEPVIRQSAYNDLQEETKMAIEFQPTADKSKRESQLMLWEKWWETEGKVKFG